jgi:hypothetical protein
LFRQQQPWTEALQDLEFVRRFSRAAAAGTYGLHYDVYQALGDPHRRRYASDCASSLKILISSG